MVSKRQWFMRFLLRSLTQRVGRVAVASLSVTIAVAIVVSALGLSSGIRAKLGQELKAYGANIIVTSAGGLDQASAEHALSSLESIDEFTFQLYGSLMVQGVGIEIIGMDIGEASGWKVEGRLPVEGAAEGAAEGVKEALVGSVVLLMLGIERADTIT